MKTKPFQSNMDNALELPSVPESSKNQRVQFQLNELKKYIQLSGQCGVLLIPAHCAEMANIKLPSLLYLARHGDISSHQVFGRMWISGKSFCELMAARGVRVDGLCGVGRVMGASSTQKPSKGIVSKKTAPRPTPQRRKARGVGAWVAA